MSDPLVVLITAPDDTAQKLAAALLDRRLIACANLLPGALSMFRWEGRVETERETVMICKTTQAHYAALEAALAELHPYDVPECIALESSRALRDYADWVEEETDPDTLP